jgi:beta-glucanase (GH16 family)
MKTKQALILLLAIIAILLSACTPVDDVIDCDLNPTHEDCQLDDDPVDCDLTPDHEDCDTDPTPNDVCPHLENIDDWEAVWCDEFDYVGLPDNTKWNYDVGGHGWGNGEAQYYTNADEDNAYSDGEYLTITAIKEDYMGNEYTSARLVTKEKGDWLYGKIQVRAKLPGGRGTWPAVWMLPTDWAYGGWPDSGEIDIMEHVGYDPNVVHSTIHTGAYNHMLGTQIGFSYESTTLMSEFHVYEIEWEPGIIRTYIDGNRYATFTFNPNNNINVDNFMAWPFDQDFHLILNIAVGGAWGGAQGIDPDIWPREMVIDYVRVYQKDYAAMDTENPTSVTELEALDTTSNSVYLAWEKATDDVMVKEYQIFVNGVLTTSTSLNGYYLKGLLPATEYTIGVVSVDFAGQTSVAEEITITTDAPAPFTGRIEAEDYSMMEGIDTQTTDDIGGGDNVGWTDAGDFLEYVLVVEEAGTYQVTFRVASDSSGGSFLFKLNNTTTLSSISFPATGGWQTWTDVTSDTFTLEAGVHTFTIAFTSAGTNLNYFEIEKVE